MNRKVTIFVLCIGALIALGSFVMQVIEYHQEPELLEEELLTPTYSLEWTKRDSVFVQINLAFDTYLRMAGYTDLPELIFVRKDGKMNIKLELSSASLYMSREQFDAGLPPY